MNVVPWDYMADFNAILGAHEKLGACPALLEPCQDFSSLFDENELIHLDTQGARYTWCNGRATRDSINIRLGRMICNDIWLSSWKKLSYCTLTRNYLDHHPLLFQCLIK